MPDDPNKAPPETPAADQPADGQQGRRPPSVDADTIDAWLLKVLKHNAQENPDDDGADLIDDSHLGD